MPLKFHCYRLSKLIYMWLQWISCHLGFLTSGFICQCYLWRSWKLRPRNMGVAVGIVLLAILEVKYIWFMLGHLCENHNAGVLWNRWKMHKQSTILQKISKLFSKQMPEQFCRWKLLMWTTLQHSCMIWRQTILYFAFYHVFKLPMGRRQTIWGLILVFLESPFPIF